MAELQQEQEHPPLLGAGTPRNRPGQDRQPLLGEESVLTVRLVSQLYTQQTEVQALSPSATGVGWAFHRGPHREQSLPHADHCPQAERT